jgi:hypothetical protein
MSFFCAKFNTRLSQYISFKSDVYVLKCSLPSYFFSERWHPHHTIPRTCRRRTSMTSLTSPAGNSRQITIHPRTAAQMLLPRGCLITCQPGICLISPSIFFLNVSAAIKLANVIGRRRLIGKCTTTAHAHGARLLTMGIDARWRNQYLPSLL